MAAVDARVHHPDDDALAREAVVAPRLRRVDLLESPGRQPRLALGLWQLDLGVERDALDRRMVREPLERAPAHRRREAR